MNFKRCISCGLELPLSVLEPIQIKHQGKILTVPICNICKTNKESEAKGRKNADN